jgi:hypothetical protein
VIASLDGAEVRRAQTRVYAVINKGWIASDRRGALLLEPGIRSFPASAGSRVKIISWLVAQ